MQRGLCNETAIFYVVSESAKVQIVKMLPPLAVSCHMEMCYKIRKKLLSEKGFLSDKVF